MKPTLNYSHPDVLYRDSQKEIVKATSEHAAYLQHHMRDEDRFECSLHNISVWKALHLPLGTKGAETWTGVYEGTPVCMFGTSPLEEQDGFRSGSIWMLGSTEIEKLYRPFLRLSKLAADHLCSQYDIVENVVPIEHSKTIMWLTWLGFRFMPKLEKINETECLRFVRCTSCLNVTVE